MLIEISWELCILKAGRKDLSNRGILDSEFLASYQMIRPDEEVDYDFGAKILVILISFEVNTIFFEKRILKHFLPNIFRQKIFCRLTLDMSCKSNRK